MNVLGICAGVGGLELGIRIAEPGARGVAYVEREAYAAAILVARMEDGWLHPAPVWSDLGTFDPEPWRGVVHCVASGDPCQPNSVAGQQKGADDDRWLIDHVLRVVDCLRPHRVFRENVPGNTDGQLEALVPALEGMGYRVAAGIFSAAEVGASHRRERLFIMADRECAERRTVSGRGAGGPDWKDGARGKAPGQPRDGGEDVADPGCRDARRGEPLALSGRGSEAEHYESGAAVGSPECTERRKDRQPRKNEWQYSLPGRWQESADRPGASSQTMAVPGEPGLPLTEQRGEPGAAERGLEAGPAATELRGGPLPVFAPGPSDPRWLEVLRDAPHLEPAVCRVAAGLAPELDPRRPTLAFRVPTPTEYVASALRWRIDRLRACGNGVVPLAAAYAWRALDAALRAERAARERVAAVAP